jgi:hypothetical protein
MNENWMWKLKCPVYFIVIETIAVFTYHCENQFFIFMYRFSWLYTYNLLRYNILPAVQDVI